MLFELFGDDVEPLLANKGEGLTGLEVLVGRIASKRVGRPVHPRLDAEGFRANRKEALEELAQTSAEEVRRTRRPALLPPLAPWERRLVHLALVGGSGARDRERRRRLPETRGGSTQEGVDGHALLRRVPRHDRRPRDPGRALGAGARAPLGTRTRAAFSRRSRRGSPSRLRGRATAASRAVLRRLAAPRSTPASRRSCRARARRPERTSPSSRCTEAPSPWSGCSPRRLRAGARPARPGEFTERAFRAGKLDLVRAEAVRDLIEARTPAAARASARRLAGGLSQRIEAVRQDLLGASAALTARDRLLRGRRRSRPARGARSASSAAGAALARARGDGSNGKTAHRTAAASRSSAGPTPGSRRSSTRSSAPSAPS